MHPKTQSETEGVAVTLARIANLLGLLATKDMKESDKVVTLTAAGFSGVEIARLLNKDVNTVHVMLSQQRRKKSRARR